MRQFRNFILLSLIGASIFSGGCKTTPEKEDKGFIEQAPPDEKKGMTLQPVVGIENLDVLSATPGEARGTDYNSYLIEIPLPDEVLMRCSYIKGNDSPVYVIKDFYEKIKARPDMEKFEVTGFSAGVMGRLPVITSKANYILTSKLTGYVESVTLSSIGFVISCYVEKEGISDVFMESVKSISESKLVEKLMGRIRKYLRREIYTVKLNDSVIGYSENYVFNDSTEFENYYMISNYFINQGEGKLYAGEIIEDTFSELKTGYVTSGKYYSSQNNATEYKLELNETSPGNYSITGDYKGSPIEKAVTAPEKERVIAVDFILKNPARLSKNKTLKILQFHPSYPDKLFDSELVVNEVKKDSGNFTYKSGPVILDYETDSQGVSVMKMGNEKMQMLWERIYSE